jgi:hypothetical protein
LKKKHSASTLYNKVAILIVLSYFRFLEKYVNLYVLLSYHCEGSRGLGLRLGLRLGLGLGLTFNCIQSFKSGLFEPLFLATFKVFFTVN